MLLKEILGVIILNNIIKKGIQGFLPVYGSNGENGIYIYTHDGEENILTKV